MTIKEPKNKNYCAVVVALSKFVDLPNCDNVKAALVFGNSVIVSKDAEIGALGMFFPVETALSKEFLSENNLFRKPEWGNVDKDKKGYFEEHGRIKAVKFRGHKSEGFWIPMESLSYLKINTDILSISVEFDQIDGHEICQKYISKSNKGQGTPRNKQGRTAKAEDRIVEGQFRFHTDTENLRRNIHRIFPDDWISISDKWHGTSAVFSHILIKRELNLFEKLLRFVGVNINEQEYGFTWSSRRVIKGVGGEAKEGAVHFYGTDIWGAVAKEVEAVIPKGFTLYGEIVGYTPDGGAIQKGYHYGCTEKSHRFLVYRITTTNADGKMMELSWQQMKTFCAINGLEMVHELYFGTAIGFYDSSGENQSFREWQEGFLDKLEKTYIKDGKCPHNNKEVPAEGIVVRIERFDELESFKLKNFSFLKRESDLLDNGESDVESEESQVIE